MTDPSSSKNGLPAPPPTTSSIAAKVGWIIATVMASVAILLAFRIATSETEVKILRTDAELARMETQSQRQQLEAERILTARQIDYLKAQPALTFVFLKSPNANAAANQSATIAWQPSTQVGTFLSNQLPPPAPGEEYRLWLEDASGWSSNAGAVAVGQDGTAQVIFKTAEPVKKAVRITLTRERLSSVGQPSGPVVLTGSL